MINLCFTLVEISIDINRNFCFSYIVLICELHNFIIFSTFLLIAFLNICVLGDFVSKMDKHI